MEVAVASLPHAGFAIPPLHSLCSSRFTPSLPPRSFEHRRPACVTCAIQDNVVDRHAGSAKRVEFSASDETASAAESIAPVAVDRRAFVAASLLASLSLNVPSADCQEDDLRLYEDARNGFSIRPPAAWEQREKAGATALFEDPERRSSSLGVVVNPVRVRSLRDFGDIDLVATRLLDAERRKERTKSAVVLLQRVQELPAGIPLYQESTKSAVILSQRVKELPGGIPLYQIEYALDSTRGTKRILTSVTIADRKLYIVNITVADSVNEPVDLDELQMLRRALDSFALLG